jgi:hypothetical protein
VSFDPTWQFVSLIPGGVGFVLFVLAKTRPMVAAECRAAAHGVSVFCDQLAALVATGAIIGFMLWYAIRLGW